MIKRPASSSLPVLVWLALTLCPAAFADEAGTEDSGGGNAHWASYRQLLGSWEGRVDDRLGRGAAQRRYELIFDEQFLMGWHESVRLPQEKSPRGDFHQELSIFSFDKERTSVVLRQFIIEGYVLQFACESETARIVCVAEDIENGPDMKARLTIEFEHEFRFSEVFELAGPGADLEPLTEITFTRIPDLAE